MWTINYWSLYPTELKILVVRACKLISLYLITVMKRTETLLIFEQWLVIFPPKMIRHLFLPHQSSNLKIHHLIFSEVVFKKVERDGANADSSSRRGNRLHEIGFRWELGAAVHLPIPNRRQVRFKWSVERIKMSILENKLVFRIIEHIKGLTI